MNRQHGVTCADLIQVSDAALLTNIAARGERLEASFQELHDRYYQSLLRFLAFRAGVTITDAEDLAAETFLVVFLRADTYNPEEGVFRSWLFRIARNKVIDLHRARRHEGTTGDTYSDALVDVTARLTETELWVASAVSQLARAQQDLIKMKYFEGYTEEEIAFILRIPKGTLSTKLRAARNELRLRLEGAASQRAVAPDSRVDLEREMIHQ